MILKVMVKHSLRMRCLSLVMYGEKQISSMMWLETAIFAKSSFSILAMEGARTKVQMESSEISRQLDAMNYVRCVTILLVASSKMVRSVSYVHEILRRCRF